MDFARVLVLVSRFFTEVDQRFAVIGALGLAAQGHSRATFDVDIVTTGEIQADLIGFLESMGYRTEHCSSGYSNHAHSDPDLGRLDVVYLRGESSMAILEGATMQDGPSGVRIPVPRPEHLAALKIFAIKNNPLRVLQDLEDVRRILQFPGVDKDEIEGYFRRYGLEGLLDRIE
jgi:hypothetical protein